MPMAVDAREPPALANRHTRRACQHNALCPVFHESRLPRKGRLAPTTAARHNPADSLGEQRMVGDHEQRHMVRSRAAALVFTALALAAILPSIAAHGDDATAAADEARPMPRSHIQPVGEVASTIQSPAPSDDDATTELFGMHVIRVPNLLRRHLGLGHGVGLVVTRVAPHSAAQRWGFLVNDVLVSIDDQSLIVPEQFAVLLQGTAAGAVRSCTLIRNGSRMTVSLDGQTRQPSEPRSDAATASAPRSLPAATPAKTPATPAKDPTTGTTKRPLAPTSSSLALLPNKKQARALASSAGTPAVAGVVRRKGDTGVVQKDFDYTIEVSREDETRLVVLDGRGRQIFGDVIETPEQRSRVPLAVRDRVEQLEKILDQQLQAATRQQPVAEIGKLDIAPIQLK